MKITEEAAFQIKTELNKVVIGMKKRVQILSIFEEAKIDFNKLLKKKNIGLVKKLIKDIHFSCFKHKTELSTEEFALLEKSFKIAYYNYSSGGKKFKTIPITEEEPPILEPDLF